MVGFRIPLAGFRIPKRGFWIPQTKITWIPDYLTWGDKSNHVTFACFVLLAVSEEAKHEFSFFSLMNNKIIIIFDFCDIQNNQGLGKGYQPKAETDKPYVDFDYSGYHKNLIQ